MHTGVERTRADGASPVRKGVSWLAAMLLALTADATAGALPSLTMTSAMSMAAAQVADEATGASAGLRTEPGQAALQGASAAKRVAYELEGDPREAALLEAARAYGIVADTEAFGVAERVEAAYRAGELLRSRGRAEEALARFGQATRLGESVGDDAVREFAARGLLEQAHVRRREDATDAALALYAAVRNRFAEQSRQSVHAATWTGKILLQEERLDEAREVILDLDPYLPDYALEAIRNVDTLSLALVDAGRSEEAREAVARLEGRLEPLLADGETMAERVESALGSLRVKVVLSGY